MSKRSLLPYLISLIFIKNGYTIELNYREIEELKTAREVEVSYRLKSSTVKSLFLKQENIRIEDDEQLIIGINEEGKKIDLSTFDNITIRIDIDDIYNVPPRNYGL